MGYVRQLDYWFMHSQVGLKRKSCRICEGSSKMSRDMRSIRDTKDTLGRENTVMFRIIRGISWRTGLMVHTQ